MKSAPENETSVQDADTVVDTRVFVEHTITFILADEERYVVPRRHTKGYLLVGYVTVHLHHDQRVWITASGSVCRKDGSPHGVTSMNESVDLADADRWIERARAALIDGTGSACQS